MSYTNGILYHDDSQGLRGPRGLPGLKGDKSDKGDGYHLTSDGDYDLQNRNLVNVKNGVNGSDAVTKSQLDTKTSLLQGARPGFVVNDKAVIYSDTGSVHAQSLYLKDTPDGVGNSDEIRIMTEYQSYDNIHLYIPNLENYDGFGGRKRSEMMVTSVDQTVTGKKIFAAIEVPNPTSNSHPVNKQYLDSKLGTKLDKIITTNVNLNNKQLQNLGYDINDPGDVVSLGFTDQKYLQNISDSDLNMNEHRIINSLELVNSRDLTTKNYVDQNFLNRITGGQIGGDLDMRGHTIKYLKLDNTESAAARVAELNLKLNRSGDEMDGDLILQPQPYPVQGNTHKAISYNTTRVIFLNKKEGGQMENTLDMNNHFTVNVKTPVNDSDASTKGYIDNTLAKSHLISSHKINEFKYLDDTNDTSSEYNITVDAFTDFNEPPHQNKKAFEITIQKDAGSNDYRARMGFNLFPLPLGKDTVVFKYFFPEPTNIQLSCQATTAYVHKQVQKDFAD